MPVWTLTTQEVDVATAIDGSIIPERLGELRSVLADRSRGLPLDAASPLATHLSRLVTQTPKLAVAVSGGEVLYRKVVPAKVAAQVGDGLVRPMAAVRDFVFSSGAVDELLRTSHKLRELGEGVADSSSCDVNIEMVRESDGSVVVFPAVAA